MTRTALLAVIAVALLTADAHAYHFNLFSASANKGGGSKIYFTGSPRFKGYDCTMCHVNPAERISVDLTSSPPGLFDDSSYQAGTRYRVDVTLSDQYLPGNNNTFIAEMVDDAGMMAGSYELEPEVQGMLLMDSERVVYGHGTKEGFEPRTWSFWWNAPAAGTGPVTFYVGMVHGDLANDDEVDPVTDPLRDDTVMLEARMCEGAGSCPEDEPEPMAESSAQCNASSSGASGWAAIFIALAMIAIPRRRFASFAAMLLVGGVALSGCFDPKTTEECEDFLCGDAAVAPPPAPDAAENPDASPDKPDATPPAVTADSVCTQIGSLRNECNGLPHGPEWHAYCVNQAVHDCGPGQLVDLSSCLELEGCGYQACLLNFDCVRFGDGG